MTAMSQTISREKYDDILKSARVYFKFFENKRECFIFDNFTRKLIETKLVGRECAVMNIQTYVAIFASRLDPTVVSTVDRVDNGQIHCHYALSRIVLLAKLAKAYQEIIDETDWPMVKAFSVGTFFYDDVADIRMSVVYQLQPETHRTVKKLVERMRGLKKLLEMRVTSSKIEAELPSTVHSAKVFPDQFIDFVEQFMHRKDTNDDNSSSDKNVVDDDAVAGQYFWATETNFLKLMLERATLVSDTIFDALGRPTLNEAWQHPIYLRQVAYYEDRTTPCRHHPDDKVCKFLSYHWKWEFYPDVPPTQSSFWELD